MGRLLITTGLRLVVVGLAIVLGERWGIRLGRLPGDIGIEGRRVGFYFPIVTCLAIQRPLVTRFVVVRVALAHPSNLTRGPINEDSLAINFFSFDEAPDPAVVGGTAVIAQNVVRLSTASFANDI